MMEKINLFINTNIFEHVTFFVTAIYISLYYIFTKWRIDVLRIKLPVLYEIISGLMYCSSFMLGYTGVKVVKDFINIFIR